LKKVKINDFLSIVTDMHTVRYLIEGLVQKVKIKMSRREFPIILPQVISSAKMAKKGKTNSELIG